MVEACRHSCDVSSALAYGVRAQCSATLVVKAASSEEVVSLLPASVCHSHYGKGCWYCAWTVLEGSMDHGRRALRHGGAHLVCAPVVWEVVCEVLL